MSHDLLRRFGLFDTTAPRYTSYPTAPNFSPAVAAEARGRWLGAVDPAVPVSVYVHIPFCERLCWFCACTTQGTSSPEPVERYVAALEAELALVEACLPSGVRMGRLHWGGGTPTILTPALIHRLAAALRRVFPPAGGFEFSVEIDPALVDRDKIAALAQEGMTRASIGIQDFDPAVQAAIGRPQTFAQTRACVDDLRGHGIGSVNADLVYGLPLQDGARLMATVDQALSLAPDRVALFGYAHVPWVSKRQRMIDETTLADGPARHAMAEAAALRLVAAGLGRIGIDHFARPGDGLATAAAEGRLRRNFQGYTDDSCPTLIGLGASSISRHPEGYVQNQPATGAWRAALAAGQLPGMRGHAMAGEDRLRARAIEMVMCDLAVDFPALARAFGPQAAVLAPLLAALTSGSPRLAAPDGDSAGVVRIEPWARPLARLIASRFDAYLAAEGRFSRAS
jgi:oxygen-independent coproporphyrinogen-3 oxidase